MAKEDSIKGEPSAYARLMQHKRREDNLKVRRGTHAAAMAAGRAAHQTGIASEPNRHGTEKERRRKRLAPAYCNAKKKDGTRCRQAAGMGTSHFGTGACKFHGGNAPTHIVAATKQSAQLSAILLGAPKEINPLDAIIWVIQIRAGEVEWLSERIAELEKDEWISESVYGKRLHLYVTERNNSMNELVKASSDAIRLGLAERAVKLAEQYGEMLARLIRGITDDLMLTDEQREALPQIVRRHLILVNGGLSAGELPAGTDEIIEVAS